MKKKILLFASTVLAAMTMATCASAAVVPGDMNENGKLDLEDPSLILEIALSRDAAGDNGSAAALEKLDLANLDGDIVNGSVVSHFDGTPEITANDAALAYKKFINKTSLKIEIYTEQYPVISYNIDENGFDTKVKDVAEFYIDKYAEQSNYGMSIRKNLAAIKFGLEKSDGTPVNATPYQTEGWHVFAHAFNSLYTTPVYDTAIDDYKVISTGSTVISSDVATALHDISVPVLTNEGANEAAITAQYPKTVYDAAYNTIAKHSPSAEDMNKAKDEVIRVFTTKPNANYHFEVALNGDGAKKSYVTDKNGDEIKELIDNAGADGIFNYDDVTVGDFYRAGAKYLGITEKDESTDGEFGSIEFIYNSHDIEVALVRE